MFATLALALVNMGEKDEVLSSGLSKMDLKQFISYDVGAALQLFHYLFEVLSSNAYIQYLSYFLQDEQQMIPCFFSVLLNMSPSLNTLKIFYR